MRDAETGTEETAMIDIVRLEILRPFALGA